MEQEKYIKKCCLKKGESINSVANRTGHDWRTIKKYVDKEDYSDTLVPKEIRKSKIDRFKPIIDKWLYDDLKMPRKQRHTAVRVYNRLREEYKEIFDVSIRTVSTYVAAKKREIFKEDSGFLPLSHPVGEAQADFGEIVFAERGKETKGYFLTLSFPYSNASYWQIFKGQNLECLLTGLKSIFEYIGGVPTTIWFDNLSPVVSAIKKSGERVLTERFEKFALHYAFEHNFCNPNSGHEKGNVESKVGYNRRNYFVPMPQISSIMDYNKYLLSVGDKDMNRLHYKKKEVIANLFVEDKKALLPLPKHDFDIYRLEKFKVNLYGKIIINQNYEYSISPAYAGKEVWAKINADEVIILTETYEFIIKHERLYGDAKESMNWIPYLDLMAKRPNALKYTSFYENMPQNIKEYFDNCKLEEKKAGLKVLSKIIVETSMDIADSVFSLALQKSFKDEDSLLSIFYRISNKNELPQDIELPSYVPKVDSYTIDISAYDNFFKGGESRI